MYIQDTGKHATVGDLIGCIFKDGTKVEGFVTYDFNDDKPPKMSILTKEHKIYDFEKAEDFWIIQVGPFHHMVENINPKVDFGFGDKDDSHYEVDFKYDDGPNTECKTETNFKGDGYIDYDDVKSLEYQYGESACDVFERWCKTLNRSISNQNKNNRAIIDAILDLRKRVSDLE